MVELPRARTIRRLGPRPADEKIVRLDVTIYQVLFVYRLNPSNLEKRIKFLGAARGGLVPSVERPCRRS